MTRNAQPLLEMKNICRHYQSGETVVKAVDDVSLSIWEGEFIAIMGQSGSGKSTLMNLLGCLDSPSAGSYAIAGEDVSGFEPDELAALRCRTFGFIFQRYNLLKTASAQENVEIPGIYDGMARQERSSRSAELLARLGLGSRSGHKPSELSGGQQQRVAIARALMNDPPVILADEPTGALDSQSGEEVMELLKGLNREGHTVILITHDAKVAAHAARMVRLHDGHVVEDTRPNAPEKDAPLPAERPARSPSVIGEVAEAFKTSLRALRVNLFRTALTLLGIIIGVAAVVTMMAIGNGSKEKVLGQISALGTNLLSIQPGIAGFRGGGDIVTLTTDDAAALLDIPNVSMVVPERRGRETIRIGNRDYATSVSGVGKDMPAVRDWPVAKGAFFTDYDVKRNAAVIVLGQTVVKTLFPDDDDPIGQYVLVHNIPFEVIGVLSTKGALPWGGDQDDATFVPVTTGLTRLFGQNYVNNVTVKITDLKQIDETQARITALLTARHRKEDFHVRNTASFIDMATTAQNTLTVLLGAVAAISLLVGGIGVMNIMLVSVTERTREIGIRMATGARMRDIMLQFNIEAAVVCIIGGLLGILFGLAAGWAVSLFDVSVAFSLVPPLLAFCSAVLTGLVFGYLPARKAALLDPVVALSSE
ncbi:MAG: MacB family efflux pump subunit [Alphaproteobacteria bacterium]|nr:MacB family efflux pump subunit [Alphaproteobacteria bacterium]